MKEIVSWILPGQNVPLVGTILILMNLLIGFLEGFLSDSNFPYLKEVYRGNILETCSFPDAYLTIQVN